MPTNSPDRRRHARRQVREACKIYDPASRRFGPGRTEDLSPGGARLVVQWLRPLTVGDEVDLAVGGTKPLAAADEMTRARVRRIEAAYGEVQVIAVEFQDEMGLGVAA